MQALVARFKEPEGVLFNGLAITYAVAAYVAGLTGLFHGHWAVNAAAMLLLAHGMVIAAYLIHECAHNSVFRSHAANARLGSVMSWLCGASYGTFRDMRYKHFRHHVDNDDVVWFDYERFFREHPAVLRITRFLEWFYIPAHELIMHGIMALTSFVIPQRRNQRRRNFAVIIIRVSIFLAVLYFSPKAAILYAVAYIIMLHVLRFMDSLQHDYGPSLTLFTNEQPPQKGDAEWEQAHTFSNPHSLKHEWLNWLTLNFGFHNAHHADMNVPWYRLPALHRELYSDDSAGAVIPFASQIKVFHTYRVARIMHDAEGADWAPYPQTVDYLRAAQAGRISGGNAASFLTSF